MIQEAWFKEFRALRSVHVPLEPLTVLVGPNGSGKTSVLEGIHDLLLVAGRPFKEVMAGPQRHAKLHNTRAQGAMEIGISLGDTAITGQLTLSVTRFVPKDDSEDSDPPSHQVRFRAVAGEKSGEWDPNNASLRDQGPLFAELAKQTGSVLFLRLSPRSLAAASYAETEEPVLGADGEGLASVLADLATREPERLEAITDALRRVVPSVRRIRTRRAAVMRTETEFITAGNERVPLRREQRYWGNRVLLDTASGDSIPLQAVSEGTVLTLGLMTVLHGSHRPRTLLMDDLDRALHPRAQEDLVKVLRAVLAQDPGLQIVATSHSPFLLNELSFGEVRVTTLADDGSVLCAPLDQHPSFETWKDQVRPGELWTAELETWLRQRAEHTA